jgi:hypothetical protein
MLQAGLGLDPLDDFGTPGVTAPSVAPFRETPRDPVRTEMRGHIRLQLDPARERMRSGEALNDPYDIRDIMAMYAPTNGDPRRGNVDNEIDFNWKRWETYGRRDYSELRGYHQQGWREVMHYNFPGRFAPEGTEGPVVVKDMLLMERPMRLTVKARSEEILAATQAMKVNQVRMTTTPEGQAPRTVFADRTTREAIAIPE